MILVIQLDLHQNTKTPGLHCIPDNRIAIKENIHASFLVAVDLVAANGTSPVAQDNNPGTQTTVDSITLQPGREKGKEKTVYTQKIIWDSRNYNISSRLRSTALVLI